MRSALLLLAAAASVSAHSTWQEFWVGSTDEAQTNCRTVKDNSPITPPLTSPDMFCGRGPKSTSVKVTVAAGTNFTVEMHAQPGDRDCSKEAIGGNHYGPVLVYMGKVADATTASSASFFKVAEDGYAGTVASWGTQILNSKCGKRAVTVPASLAPGDYLVRAEVIALHAGAGNPQPYVSCFQITVTGSGTANPAGVSFPGAYKMTDPLFSVSIWDSNFKYVSPGPAVWTG